LAQAILAQAIEARIKVEVWTSTRFLFTSELTATTMGCGSSSSEAGSAPKVQAQAPLPLSVALPKAKDLLKTTLKECNAWIESPGCNAEKGPIGDAVTKMGKRAYGIINAGSGVGSSGKCPFASAEEVQLYYDFCFHILVCWRDHNMGENEDLDKDLYSQFHVLCEVLSFLDVDAVPLPEETATNIQSLFREALFPNWIRLAERFNGDAGAGACLRVGMQWKLDNIESFQNALTNILDKADGVAKLPGYWDRTILRPEQVERNCGLDMKDSDNIFKCTQEALKRQDLAIHDKTGKNFAGTNMCARPHLTREEVASLQQLFDASLRKKYTRDRKGGGVPDRLLVTRGDRIQNVKNWMEYSQRRSQIKSALSKNDHGLLTEIDDLKTAGILPDCDKWRLDVGANEQWLFHGTNDNAAGAITKGDFLVSMAGSNAGTLYGKGLYLAESVSKSDEYTDENASGERCMLVCRSALGFVNYNDEPNPDPNVLVSSCTKGSYHCVLGDREKLRGTFREIIVYDDDQVYPEYVLWYKRVYN